MRHMTVTDEQSLILFPEGLVGWANWKRFILLTESDEDLPIGILKSVDEPNVSLMVTDPLLVLPKFRVELTADDRAALDLEDDERPVLYCTLTMGGSGAVTANLLGPLAINSRTRRGKQLVLADTLYSPEHPVGVVESVECLS